MQANETASELDQQTSTSQSANTPDPQIQSVDSSGFTKKTISR